jgi:hypothetical protein
LSEVQYFRNSASFTQGCEKVLKAAGEVLDMTPKNQSEAALRAAELVLTTLTEDPK